ncbi:ArsR/SmtB family transcription factor [Humisphaera borealis]|uniref:Winged helix-turn-helix transcriptional regulator n=1 Tax=Humisphaera borealis TaxID=2807512 RepID=A0A7M2WU33_9BACT|nr:metalloregulator ArsR/SmtB family transcription factor [Humisphaera borealis]QOV88672.1 winged helix-turn-helix transcriptional regulator [Humisphaera borealis]
MRQLISVTSALSDENRVRVVAALHRHGELCVCQIVELLGLAASTVSKHLSLLHSAALIDGRKQGRWMYYRIASNDIPETARKAIEWVVEVLSDDPRMAADDIRVRGILGDNPEDLCKRQTARIKSNRTGESSTCCSSAPGTPVGARWPKGSPGTSGATSSKRTRRASTRTE